MKNIFVYLVFVLVAVATGCAVTNQGNEILGIGSALLAFMLCLQIYSFIMHSLDRKKHRKELAELETALAATQAKLDGLTQKYASKATDQNRKLVSQLMNLEHLMREQAQFISRSEADDSTGTFDPFENAGQAEILAALRSALTQKRMDFLAQPTVCLPQRKAQFYECFTRLRTENNQIIPMEKAMAAAASAGLTGQIDSHNLFHAVHIARRLAAKRRNQSVFCNISPMTLRDMQQLRPVLEYLGNNKDLAHMLVLEMPLDSFCQMSPAFSAVLKGIAKLGFHFAADHCENLDLDFRELQKIGVNYLKLPAEILLHGLRDAKSPVKAEDLRTYLDRYEIKLIIEKVAEEKTVPQLLDYGITLAQGLVFSPAKPTREEHVTSPQPALRQAS